MTKIDNLFQSPDKATDPVCKMQVDMSSPSGGTAEYEGESYYFCAAGCRQAFEADPSAFVSP